MPRILSGRHDRGIPLPGITAAGLQRPEFSFQALARSISRHTDWGRISEAGADLACAGFGGENLTGSPPRID